ncbi:shikimate dehydrogenase [Variovorax sp. OV329]|uniref:shikimate dehydrogenase family protein n=1 Tax=Variovorax sp. OV329 TaxID=1882825 RepID=UPI0008E3D2D0|nr:shikimate dehydrogenase [Variovorax sp. OV329]SFM96953.1 shikimate dehydrogenase [Variovorax sp. OV329]
MELTGATRLVFILAHPIGHVKAPRVYNPAFAAAGLDWFQVPMGVAPEDLVAVLGQLARVTNLQGINLTIPHKAAGHALCSWLTREARATGMVNTLRLEADGQWSGTNSDGIGFVGAARASGLLDLQRPVFIAGAGGAGTAIAFALAQEGVQEIHVSDTDPARVEALLGALRAAHPRITAGTDRDALRRAGLAVNATPMGLHAEDPLPLDPALLPGDAALFDIIAARDTELMAAAKARGLRVLGGRPMIDHQLAHQIAFWRGDAMQLEPSP